MPLQPNPRVELKPQRNLNTPDLRPAIDLASFLRSNPDLWDDAVLLIGSCKTHEKYVAFGRDWVRKTRARGPDWRATHKETIASYEKLVDALYTTPPFTSVEVRRATVLEEITSKVVFARYPDDPPSGPKIHAKEPGDVQIHVNGKLQSVDGAREIDVCVWASCAAQGAFYECKVSSASLDYPEIKLLMQLHEVLHNPWRRTNPILGIVSFSTTWSLRERMRRLLTEYVKPRLTPEMVATILASVEPYGADVIWVNLGRHPVCTCLAQTGLGVP